MERLTPAERAVFVLREAFSCSHQEIAEILDLTAPGSRQLYHRARERLRRPDEPHRRFETEPGEWHRLVERFVKAATEGDVRGLEELLAADVTAWSDGGGKVSAALRPIVGRDKVARFVLGLVGKLPEGLTITVEEVNGAPAVVTRLLGTLFAIALPEIVDGEIIAVRTVINPDKLQRDAGHS